MDQNKTADRTTRDPVRDLADEEIESCLSSYGGWMGWFGEFPGSATRALAWKGSQGDAFPEQLHELRNALAQFGNGPIEEAVARVQGLERAFAELEAFVDVGLSGEEAKGVGSHAKHQLVAIREIVRRCVMFSGHFPHEVAADKALVDALRAEHEEDAQLEP